MYLELTKQSNKLIKNLLVYLKKENLVHVNGGLKKICHLMFSLFKSSEKRLDLSILPSIMKKHSVSHKEITTLLQGKFIDENIREEIRDTNVCKYQVQMKILGKPIVINLYVERNKKIKSVYTQFYFAIKIIHFIVSLNKTLCKSSLTINLFDYSGNHSKKQLPEMKSTILGPYHVNSGYTYSCVENNILVVFRREECYKVLIHELLHSQGFDSFFIQNYELEDKVQTIFGLDCKLHINESYIEFLTLVFYSGLNSFLLMKERNQTKYSEFIENFRLVFTLERNYNILNTLKILEHMNLEYPMLYSKDANIVSLKKMLYKEDTNVFCYYILKNLFLFCNNEILDYLVKHKFVIHDSMEFIKIMDNLFGCFNKKEILENFQIGKRNMQKLAKNKYFRNTLNMCLFVWNI